MPPFFMKWSLFILYRFTDFLNFLHNEKSIIIYSISISRLYKDMIDFERGEYVVEFYIIDNQPKQLSLF